MHEFLLEQLSANLALQSTDPQANWREFGDDFIAKMGRPYTNQELTADQQAWVEQQTQLGQELARRFVDKVALRLRQG